MLLQASVTHRLASPLDCYSVPIADDEQASQYSATAGGDDSNGKLDANDVVIDDEDGVIFTRPLVRGSSTNAYQ